MPSDSPGWCIPFALQPLSSQRRTSLQAYLVSDRLNICILHLERAVMWSSARVDGKEDGMMVDVVFSTIHMEEPSDRRTIWGSENVAGYEIEILRPKVIGPVVIANQSGRCQ